MTKYSTRIDAADFADGQKTCCMLPLRWATVTFGIVFAAAGACQLVEQVYRANGGSVEGYNLQEKSNSTLTLLGLACCMLLSGVSGCVGAFFEIRHPVTFFALMLLFQCFLEIAWFVLEDSTGTFADLWRMLWSEIVLGNRSTNSPVAVNLFYTLMSLNIHLWACGVVASYALELRVAGKTVWFEPIDDDDDVEEAAETPLKGQETTQGSESAEGYGATPA
ncbi:unnamed protein product [Symbiodinium natans]|uniref:Uncharacterized protein n=1 Tax=Symbiodinium natans TaxID=878477 RepID=A0A812RCL3_9DINO|nr:unnamed protein product [Symbiodinium natans]